MGVEAAELLEARSVSRTVEDGIGVREISSIFERGRLHVLRGAERSGHELLLRILGLLEVPESGEVFVDGHPTAMLSEEDRALLRARRFGFVFASPFLLGSFSVVENIAMPLLKLSQATTEEARQRTEELLALVDLADAAEAAISELTPCAQYHVAAARGLVNAPAVLIVESVDGVLAGEELRGFVSLLQKIAVARGVAVIASASAGFAAAGPEDRVLEIVHGSLAGDLENLREIETE